MVFWIFNDLNNNIYLFESINKRLNFKMKEEY